MKERILKYRVILVPKFVLGTPMNFGYKDKLCNQKDVNIIFLVSLCLSGKPELVL